MRFPLCGIDISSGFERQPNRPAPDGQYARTTPFGRNVRAFEPVTGRARGGQRAGLKKYVPAQVSDASLIQALQTISGTGYAAPGGGVQSSQSGRVVTLVAVSQGNVRVADAGASAWVTPTGGAAALNTSGVIFSASNSQKLFFADGTNQKYYDPALNSVLPWVASAGIFPQDSAGNRPRLICNWNDRIVQSGVLKEPQLIYMAKKGVPTDFDYSPLSPSPIQAVFGTDNEGGQVGDVVTSLIPFTDDVLFIGADHSLWVMRGDPMLGGKLDNVSKAIGVAFGEPWCTDPYGNIYFVSNRMGIYVMPPGEAPRRISQQIEQLLQTVNTGSNTIRCIWDDRFQGLHVFVSRTSAAAASVHLFWEYRTGAWWQDSFANPNFNPLCCAVFDGNNPDDRVALIGSWDGYVRFLDASATTDDGYPIASEVVIGPLTSKDFDVLRLMAVECVLGTGSGSVTWKAYIGRTAEEALVSTPVKTGTWTAGRNTSTYINRAAHALYVRLSATTPWAMEALRVKILTQGSVRARSR